MQCKKCGNEANELWPLEGGVCGECLVNNFTKEQALQAVCPCLHGRITLLYKNKRGK